MGLMSFISANPGLSAVTGCFVFLEGHYLWRSMAGMLLNFSLPRRSPRAVVNSYSICTTTDLDFFLHMNNARYYREMDFGRWNFFARTSMSRIFLSNDVKVLQSCSVIRFRKEVNLLMPFVVETRLSFWDDHSVYFEQKLKTLHDGRVRCVCYSEQRVLGSITASQLVNMAFGSAVDPPLLTDAIRALQLANKASSLQLAVEEGRS